MKTVTGRVVSAEPISLSKAATILSRFVSSENGASQDVSAYLRRAAAAFTELKSFHREVKSSSSKETKTRSSARNERDQTEEFEELGRAKGIDDLVENGGEIPFRKSEAVSEEELVYGREQDGIKEDKKKNKEEDVVDEKVKDKLEDEQSNEERKKKSKKNKEEVVVDEKVNEKLEDGQRNEERKERKKKKKSKKNKNEDVIDKEVNEKLEEEQRNQEREERKKEKKKKRKSDGEMGSDERKSKKKKKSKETDG